MNLDQLRPSFNCTIFSQHEEAQSVFQLLKNSGYQTSLVLYNFEDFVNRIKVDPPHMVILFQRDFNEVEAKAFLMKTKKLLPETALYWVGNHHQIAQVYDRMGFAFFDILGWPLVHVSRLIQGMDHALLSAYYLYENEQLKSQRLTSSPAPSSSPTSPSKKDSLQTQQLYQAQLFRQSQLSGCLDVFYQALQETLAGHEGQALYFRYIAARKTLVFQKGFNIESQDLKDVGLNFSELDENFKKSDIRNVEKHPAFLEMLRDVFSVEKFHVLRLEIAGDIQGLLVLSQISASSDQYLWIANQFTLLAHQGSAIELERRLHANQTQDPATQAMTKHHFFQLISEEVARARRTSLPLSLILLNIDPIVELREKFPSEDISMFFKTLVKIIRKHSRVNDVVGRLSEDEFALLLPHTAAKGAAIKAERIRRMIESADFSSILPGHPHITLSLGVSEYPSVCKDGDELFQAADRALFELKKTERNKVILAQAPDGFIADFALPKLNY